MPVPILLYHQIDVPPAKRMPFRSMIVHPDAFRRQMAWLRRLGYQGLSLHDAIPYIEGRKSGKVAVITFDDGFSNVYENALPVLQEYGFTATNFFVANQIGGQNAWDIPLGVAPASCMSASQIREWAALGHEVGSHTLDHVRLPDVPAEEARRQIVQARDILQDITGAPVTSFAYPYGDENARLRTIVREAGYHHATTTERRRAQPRDDGFGLPRLSIRRNDSWLHFLKKCLM
ncbi:polysaccharide deacetylase family protein [Phyllobacterium salinisoli]|uniref:Chitooligosaccharide deacetylase n=1 Tax=Phyllobacterium salinisoli TaxID=1899321 RepID=A0A368K5B7_9HYPH|nr:polysaccharide deacetylase family protein [Phyllobacterium salinisoli]RCS24569.1 polysaccharide deacetylase family protein [Phyllobacterium salinisoli]